MLCSVLVNIDQQKKVMINFCYVSENIIFFKFKFDWNFLFIYLLILDHFQAIIFFLKRGFEPLMSRGWGYQELSGSTTTKKCVSSL